MSRNEKIQKLSNAIKECRGLYRFQITAGEKEIKWVRPPKPNAIPRVVLWLERLNLPVNETLDRIQGFASYNEFDAWMKTL
jgi:hypothetical protein